MTDTRELRFQGRLQVVEMTGAWGAYAGERVIVGPGDASETAPPAHGEKSARPTANALRTCATQDGRLPLTA
jgi:hypothetical protein